MLGKTIAHYKITDRLGGGGMGVVYKAEDLKLGRTVALKFLSAELTRDPDAKKRFTREARAASLLDHPNICTIYDFGEAEDDQMFIAMACYDGESLQERLKRGPVTVREAIRIVGQIARGLAKAHSSGIVHRDIKPANVMITSDSVVKIVDFGLAKLSGTSLLTQSHRMMGTAAYMAPEQIRGESVDARADIWSLGVILFELTTGTHPFRGENLQGLSYAILNIQPPSIRELADVPPELDLIVRRMLRKDPLQRYQSIEEVLADLEPLETPSSGSGGRVSRSHGERERLRSGARLGPYEIVRPLGSGGMGDVYLSKDTRLDREVAIKILAPEFSEDAQRKERFKREAKTISSLNHPNICMLFDVGEQEGADFLVMEYIEGDTLAERLSKGPLPISQVLRFGRQIAEALDRAHRQGIVHRDLKPGNVIIARNGSVKLLDFGLAKENVAIMTSTAGRTERRSDSQDVTIRRGAESEKPLTAEGMIVGTLPYMAPEQIEGREIDSRTDIFSFGAMLYEMVTGRRAFDGKTRASLIVAIIDHDPPPIRTLQPAHPPALDHVISKCLEKDPEHRWQSAHDIATELQWIEETGGPAAEVTPSRAAGARLAIAALTILAIGLGIFGWRTYRAAHRPRPARHLSIDIPVTGALNADLFAVSPDGSRIVYSGAKEETTALFLKRLDDDSTVPIAGTDGAEGPFFSPDGESIGFFASGKLKRLELSGGNPIVVCEVPTVRGAAWGPDGTIVLSPDLRAPLARVPAAGGTPRPLTVFRKGEEGHRYPQVLPDRKHVLFTVRNESSANHSLAIVSLENGQRTDLPVKGFYGRYADGYLFWATETGFLAAPFDAKSLRIMGNAFPIASSVFKFSYPAISRYAVTSDGSLIFVPDNSVEERELVLVDLQGTAVPITKQRMRKGGLWSARPSPDGKEIAVTVAGDDVYEADIWMCETASGSCSPRVTSTGGAGAIWSRDQTKLAYTCPAGNDRTGARTICVMSSEGGAPQRKLSPAGGGAGWTTPLAWSGDGKLVFTTHNTRTNWDLFTWDLSKGDGADAVSPLANSIANEVEAVLSPDSRWVAFVSNEGGTRQIYLSSFPGMGRRWPVASDVGGLEDLQLGWSRDSNEILYISNNQLMAAKIETTPNVVIGPSRVVLDASSYTQLTVMPDGKHFVGLRSLNKPDPARKLSIVQGFLDQLRARRR